MLHEKYCIRQKMILCHRIRPIVPTQAGILETYFDSLMSVAKNGRWGHREADGNFPAIFKKQLGKRESLQWHLTLKRNQIRSSMLVPHKRT